MASIIIFGDIDFMPVYISVDGSKEMIISGKWPRRINVDEGTHYVTITTEPKLQRATTGPSKDVLGKVANFIANEQNTSLAGNIDFDHDDVLLFQSKIGALKSYIYQKMVSIHEVNRYVDMDSVVDFGMRAPGEKNKWAVFFLCLFLGFFGVHRFYERKYVTGILYLLTFGLCGIGVIFDLMQIWQRSGASEPAPERDSVQYRSSKGGRGGIAKLLLILLGVSLVGIFVVMCIPSFTSSMGTGGRDFQSWLSSFSGKIFGNQSSTVSNSPDQTAMAQAMLDVLDQAMTSNDYGGAVMADVDGDGVKELLMVCEPTALLYSWQDGQLTPKKVGVLADGYFSWYLCQDTITGESGLQAEIIGDYFGDRNITYYYPSREIHAGERIYYDDNGAVSEEHYYIDEHEVIRDEYRVERMRNRTLETLSTYSWYERGVQTTQTTVIRAELEVMRDGRTLQDISDEGLLALARIKVYTPGDMGFLLDVGGIIPQDRDDYIIVNMGHDGFGEVHAYRALDCETAVEVESLVHDIWHKEISRRYPLNYEAHIIEYTGQADDYIAGDLLRYNNAIYVVENYGLGDGGPECFVDRMISRTADEAVFQVHDDYGGEGTFSLIYEDGIWKYGESGSEYEYD